MIFSLQEDIPEGLRVQSISQGAAVLVDDQDYEVKLILVPAPHNTSAGNIAKGVTRLRNNALFQPLLHALIAILKAI